MKRLLNNIKAAFAMFSRIPVPGADWSEDNLRLMLCFFPWIGIVIGAVCIAAAWAGRRAGLEPVFCGAILTLVPVVITGGIHLDGLLDTADALNSCQEKEQRLRILKDPHTGAFAIIHAGCYFVLQLGAFSQLSSHSKGMLLAGLTFILSRSWSGMGVLTLPKASSEGTAARFSRESSTGVVRMVLTVYIIILSAAMSGLAPVMGTAGWLTALLVYIWYRRKALLYFGGTTGDLSGYFLCTCEMMVTAVLAVCTAADPGVYGWP